ncbi:MAG: fluoride efflux transporter CrcB [Chthoniobacterales bacterium]
MKQALFVGLGGFIGSIARYKLGAIVWHHSLPWRFPITTFCINVLGCFVLGALSGLGEKYFVFTADVRLLLFTGLLGGFTTFSAFGGEGVNLIRRGEIAVALSYAALSVLCGFAAVWAGMKLFGAAAGRQ